MMEYYSVILNIDANIFLYYYNSQVEINNFL